MIRRTFIAGLGSTVAWPVVAGAQQQAVPVVGILSPTSASGAARSVSEIRAGLTATGYIEGSNVAIEHRYADNQYDRLPALAADLARRQLSVIVGNSGTATLAAKAAMPTIPIVFSLGGDPVQLGLVAS